MNKLLFLLLLLVFGGGLHAQEAAAKGLYFIGFRDKVGTPYTIEEPSAFLSTRALDRRDKVGQAITELDLPISPDYESRITERGIDIWLRSKWMNGVVVPATEQQVGELRSLEFVDTTFFAAPLQYERSVSAPRPTDFNQPAPVVQPVPVTETFYGFGYKDLARMNGDSLHRLGYRGRGVWVAVFDGGFPSVGYKDFLGYDQLEAVPGNYDLVEQDSTALDGSTHGATVLSTMAAHHPFFFIGTAPEAKYLLFKTENSRGEHRMEEVNYAIALELADSVGVDVVNSSLGYTTFTDPSMDYTYQDLNGITSPASVAIGRAFERGMIIVTSAGNNGADEWKYIGIPADAPQALSIGALDATDERAYFSSFGPTPDGRVKPDVSGPGVMVAAVAANGQGMTGANGTSLSAPLITGLVACLLQAVPEATNQQVLDAIRATASLTDAPDEAIGYGKPDFAAAYRYLLREVGQP
ncbi:subtilase family protein [Neolewinella xylanilytica]|uniref:Subtilase family protein n=1 Tax=Neolewinella xylanilytica TaxID=1514080 RepID=A0A2S6I647_9BACT|nr:S8 family serine peptidase [Neolewinella xylanilytica]PPK86634.1 subtilase family protein [Neolewinella xylanilytica]